MAWPRNKFTRSSASPGADPAPGTGHNVGISGAHRAVAGSEPQPSPQSTETGGEQPMSSDTAGLSYENPEIPAGTAHHQGADLKRVVSSPEAPESAETRGYAAATEPGTASAGDHAGPHERTAILDPLPAGIDELLNSASLDDSASLGDGAPLDDSAARSGAAPNDNDGDPAPVPPAPQAAAPARPHINPRIASAPLPADE